MDNMSNSSSGVGLAAKAKGLRNKSVILGIAVILIQIGLLDRIISHIWINVAIKVCSCIAAIILGHYARYLTKKLSLPSHNAAYFFCLGVGYFFLVLFVGFILVFRSMTNTY